MRDHRCVAIHELAAPTSPPAASSPAASPPAASPSSRVRLPKRHELRGSEGPYALSFLDDRRLIGDDSSFELILWDTVTGERLAATHSIGWHGHVAIGDRLFLGGCFTTQRRFLGAHRLPSLASDGTFDDGAPASAARIRCEVIAASPSGRWLDAARARPARPPPRASR